MFEQLFTQPATVARHHSSPYAAERSRYVSHLIEEGRSRSTLRTVAQLLMSSVQHLPLHRAEVSVSDIEISAEAWARTRHRSASCLHAGKREFVFHVTKWLRLLGRLYEPQVEQPFSMERDAFLQFELQERGLAPITVDRYQQSVEELLIRLDRLNKALCDVTLDDISLHLRRH